MLLLANNGIGTNTVVVVIITITPMATQIEVFF